MSLPFGAATRSWFESNFQGPTPVQQRGWPLLVEGRHALLLAPTGSGKTLAAFLASLDRLFHDARPETGTRVLYISPLKALVYDIERNLRAPLAGIARHWELQGQPPGRIPSVAVRTGDTSTQERARQRKTPADILVTTPESLYLMLGSQMAEGLRNLETVIVDEIHSLAPTKRGAHLALSLERLNHLCGQEVQRVGLSATVDPVEQVARYLGGGRPVEVVNTLEPPRMQLTIAVPVADMEQPSLQPESPPESILGQMMMEEKLRQAGGMGHGMGAEGAGTLWSAIYPQVLQLILQHRSTILFVNSRGLCERLALRLNELAGSEVVRSHHGSVSHRERQLIEEMLKAGQLKGLVATSSLELGIDMGAVDLVIMVQSPGSVARGLQRIGRAGHGVGQLSKGVLFPKFQGDLLESTVVAQRMREGRLEPIGLPENPLDVLAQQVVAMVAQQDWPVAELHQLVQRAANYRRLSRDMLHEVLDMLAGRYPSHDFAELRPRLNWDRESDVLSARRGTRSLAVVNAGTIPDRGLYRVIMGPGGPRVGELDEEMVHEIRAGQNFLLGATTWRVEEITRDTIIVSPAPGEPGRMPFWRGDGPGRSLQVGQAMGEFLRQLQPQLGKDAEALLQRDFGLDAYAAQNLARYLQEQQKATGTLPSDRTLIVERFRDEIGDWRLCLLSPFGSRIHAPWALALEQRLGQRVGFEVQVLWSDDGISLRLGEAEDCPSLNELLIDPEELEELVVQQVGQSAMFAAQFRENAGRALLLPRKNPGQRTPLWAQRLRAQNLLAVARNFPSFPMILETYRSCLQDTFDLAGLRGLLADIRSRKLRVLEVETPAPSPFARSLVFSYTAAYLYQGDAPLAERRAQALTLDRALLAELLGSEELRSLLDLSVLGEMVEELQALTPERQAHHPDGLHDVLRQLGDLSLAEVEARCSPGQGKSWLEQLEHSRRACPVRIAGESRWVAVEDVALYRDALGVQPPSGLPAVYLEPCPAAVDALLLRYARRRGPFLLKDLQARYGLAPLQELRALVARHQLDYGDFLPGGFEREYCHPEVLRRWRKRTLARLRGQVAAVDGSALARFLLEWQTSSPRLEDAIAQLEGLPLSFSELEKSILPLRVPGFQPRQLDELGQHGWLCWVGCGTLGNRDGRIKLLRRERAALLLEPPDHSALEGVHRAIVDHLERQGASFLMELRTALREHYTSSVLEEALQDLIWSGVVTNDSLAPLRPNHPSKRLQVPVLAGRWTLVSALLTGQPAGEPTRRQLAWAQLLLDRYGVICRDVGPLEDLPQGWQGLYPLLRSMEESGKIRRGYFVEGLSAGQFALAGAVDRLRQAQSREDEGRAVVMAATDPAQPYGTLLSWPGESRSPRRVAGAKVVLVEGTPVLYLEKGARKLLTFPAAGEPFKLERALQALRELAPRLKGRCLRLEHIDGENAAQHALAGAFREAGFGLDYTGLLYMARPEVQRV